MIKAGILGATGYAGLELTRLLLRHPQAQVAAVMGISQVQVCRIEKKTLKAMARGMSQE